MRYIADYHSIIGEASVHRERSFHLFGGFDSISVDVKLPTVLAGSTVYTVMLPDVAF